MGADVVLRHAVAVGVHRSNDNLGGDNAVVGDPAVPTRRLREFLWNTQTFHVQATKLVLSDGLHLENYHALLRCLGDLGSSARSRSAARRYHNVALP